MAQAGLPCQCITEMMLVSYHESLQGVPLRSVSRLETGDCDASWSINHVETSELAHLSRCWQTWSAMLVLSCSVNIHSLPGLTLADIGCELQSQHPCLPCQLYEGQLGLSKAGCLLKDGSAGNGNSSSSLQGLRTSLRAGPRHWARPSDQ